ncbi:hypothetical protein FOT55_15010 [Serratia bockelmannii]|uniref:hypothetical protein n=1 Tax=Serratia bockelmannii TaxID=2703793 RepID=UPI0011CB6E31|nr:hypothetical protein [Serratia bockelmannii]TXE47859.1 hypothetical protein FOT55_15010 [Serratia bockelmannii]
MKERPVIFNSEMVRAILSGRKTQTRRVMKVQPSEHFHPMNMSLELDYSARWYTPGVIDKDGYLQPATGQVFGVAGEDEGYACPFGAVGDRLWVRETWSSDFANYYPNDRVWYAADNNRCSDIEVVNGVRGIYSPESDVHVPFRWRPSIHMPRWASRITLEITGVRVERLNDLSEEDAKSEGVAPSQHIITPPEALYRVGFLKLWQSIYGEESWRANPWVWAISFRRVK